MMCERCGKVLADDASFCGGCGCKQGDKSNKKSKNKEKKTFTKPIISMPTINLNQIGIKIKRFIIALLVILILVIIVPKLFSLNSDKDFKIESGAIVGYTGNNYAIYTPDNATEIGKWSFADDRMIKTITINENVNKIGTGAFEGCTSLTMITIPETVTEIGDWILAECWSLSTVSVKAGSYADAWARSYNFHSNVTIEYY